MAYFNIEFKPRVSGQNCVTAFSNTDLISGWEIVDCPKGTFRIVGTTCIIRGTEGAVQNFNARLLFGSLDQDGTAPAGLGTVNGTLDGTGYFKNLVGMYKVQTNAGPLDYLNVTSPTTSDGNSDTVFAIDSTRRVTATGSTVHVVDGKIAVAVVSEGTPDFGTGVLTTGAVSVSTTPVTITVDGVHATKALAVGDVLKAQDGASVGTVTALTTTTVTVDAVAEALANDDELVNNHPMRIILHCEI